MEVYIISNSPENEYLDTDIHTNGNKVDVTGANNLDFQLEGTTGKVYSVHLEFADTSNGIGEEIRESLKKKFIQNKLGSMQMDSSALQSTANEERSGF